MVSTDSEEIAAIGKAYGAEVPFMRSDATSGDYADTTDVLKEVLREYEKRGKRYDAFCCIYPTAPFVTAEKLKSSLEMLQAPDVNNVVPMTAFSFPPQRGMIVREKYMAPAYPEFIDKRSQDLETVYHDCGQFYWCKTAAFLENPDILANKTVPFIVPDAEAQDIDNYSDWEIAEMKYKIMMRKMNEDVQN